MKLLELEIKNIRGIKDITLHPNGKNFVISGINGSGKSAVVDAIDFLLTGQIMRLMGEGTKNITLKQHGAHIDCSDLSTAYVRAVIKTKNSPKPIQLYRCMDKPTELIINPQDKAHLILPILEIAKRGQHVLTRREILKFITAEGNKRAKDVQTLMNLGDIEAIRQALVTVDNNAEKQKNAADKAFKTTKNTVTITANLPQFGEIELLAFINENRKVLVGLPINAISASTLKQDLKAPAVIVKEIDVNTTLFQKDVDSLLVKLNSAAQKQIGGLDVLLRERVTNLHSDAKLLGDYHAIDLTRKGLELIDESGKCPLCDRAWEPGALKQYLEIKLGQAIDVSERIESIEENANFLSDQVEQSVQLVDKILAVSRLLNLHSEVEILELWKQDLKNLIQVLADPVTNYHQLKYSDSQVAHLLAPDNITDLLKSIINVVLDKYPLTTPEQTAWDKLTSLEENIRAYEKALEELKLSNLLLRRANILKVEFIKARDDVLLKLYDEIRERFEDLYRDLHHEDESSFKATLLPHEAALDLLVSFYGRGNHPPHALHSEGHQDSMGVCLFLALSEKLTEDIIDIIILDDVVMSVDIDHRRSLCQMLTKYFQGKQFLITTHDRVWANQLKSEGIVSSNELIEFFDWSLDSGPQVNDTVDLWLCIEDDLIKENVPAAAAQLRHGSEHFFAEVCDHLHANVEYKLSGRYELGDFIHPAMDAFRSIIKQGIKAAKSWGEDIETELKLLEKEQGKKAAQTSGEDIETELQLLDKERSVIYSQLGGENWALNINVHYNEWANFGKQDFRPLVASYKNLYELFTCPRCNSILYVTMKDKVAQNMRCSCGKVNINLCKKEK